MEIDTLYIVSVERGPYAANDLASAIRWTSQRPCHLIVVDLNNSVPSLEDNEFVLMKTGLQPEAAHGFHRAAAVKWAIDQGIDFKQVISMDEDCLILNQGLDTWALKSIQKQVGLIGVQDRLNCEDAYTSCLLLMSEWNMPHGRWEVAPHTVADSFTVMSSALTSALYQLNLLTPPACERWTLPYGPFISWATQMLEQFQVSWGHQDKQMPPLYCAYNGRGGQPAPHILSTQFMLYNSVRHATSYTEEDLREIYKRLRGEPAKIVQPLKPVVSGEGAASALG